MSVLYRGLEELMKYTGDTLQALTALIKLFDTNYSPITLHVWWCGTELKWQWYIVVLVYSVIGICPLEFITDMKGYEGNMFCFATSYWQPHL